jgi:hypothetical protein
MCARAMRVRVPTWRALTRVQQVLFEVDGTNVYRESLDVVAMLILGEPGTFVKLLFLRGTRIFIEATLERAYSARQVRLPSNFPFHLSTTRVPCPTSLLAVFASASKKKKIYFENLKKKSLMSLIVISYSLQIVQNLLQKWSRFCKDIL